MALLLCAMVTPIPIAMAHSGRTNADGCHTNRKTGEYHCHAGKSRHVDYYAQDAQPKKILSPSPVKKVKPRSTNKENRAKKTQWVRQ
ncbi:YHYH domain-containing protein [Serratia nematodiphila]|nr:YHYH domain-containing protein [Serratia nematodiphila]